jgi:hypothetical protein
MPDGVPANKTTPSDQAAPAVRSGISLLWPALAGLAVALAVGAVAARLAFGPRFDSLLVFAAGAAAVVLALRLLVRDPAPSLPVPAPAPIRSSIYSSRLAQA